MDEKNTTNTPKRRGRPPKSAVTAEKNEVAAERSNEFCTYSSRQTWSSLVLGMNMLDFYTEEQLRNMVKDPIANNEILRHLSLMLYGTNGVYTNTVDYMIAMPCLAKVIVPHGKNEKKKKLNKDLMSSVLRTIKDKEFIRDALFRGAVEGVSFSYFETTARPTSRQKYMTDYDVESINEINELGINASIINLPADYTQIVGIKNSSYVLAFNLEYFNDCTGEDTKKKLRKFPKEIRDAYHAKFDDGKGVGNWVVLDNNHTITHKIRSKRDEKWGRPIVLAAISDIMYSDYFTNTKRNILDELNNKIIYQTFPEGANKGKSSLTEKQQKDQHDNVKSAVMSKNNRGGVSFFSVAAGTSIKSLDVSNIDIFDQTYEGNLNDQISLDMGIASSLLNGSSSGSYSAQTNNLELLSAEIFQWVEQIENELNKCISACIIKDSKNYVECKYLPITYVNKGTMVGFMKELYLQGCGSLSLWAASCGIEPEVYFSMLDQELADGIYDKYKPHQTSYTLSGDGADDDSPGRPETDDPTDATIISRNNDGNNIPSPSDN